MERVIWTDDETDRLVGLLTSMRINDPAPSILTLLKKAQMQLPSDRRRQINTLAQMNVLLEKVELRLSVMKERAAAVNSPLPTLPSLEDLLDSYLWRWPGSSNISLTGSIFAEEGSCSDSRPTEQPTKPRRTSE